jgi:hypothetical protein
MPMATTAQTPPAQGNRLAFISIALSLVFPLGAFCFLLGTDFNSQVQAVIPPHLEDIGILLTLLGIPSTVLAIAMGYAALRRANSPPVKRSRRTVAFIAITLSYGSLAVVLGMVAYIGWILLFVPKFHIVF